MNADVRESIMVLDKARSFFDTGQHAALVEYLAGLPPVEIERSPTLALLFGIAHARMGRHPEGERWVGVSLELARQRGDRGVEARALNVKGAIALESGRVEDAAGFFMRALEEAKREGDHSTVGRCSNNLGIVANLRGDHGRAIGSYAMALAAFDQAGLPRGVAETHHNLAITYRDQGDLPKALEAADSAVEEAGAAGDRALAAQTRAGRAEIRTLSGDAQFGLREVELALGTHREIGDVVGEAEDLRVLAAALAALGETTQAEGTLLVVIARAEQHERPLLAAMARRDLAHLLRRLGRAAEAADVALTARAQFMQLGAAAEARKLDEFAAKPG